MATKILIVDDKFSLRTMVKSYLEQEGFQLVEADNGRDALYAARHEKPDLIILDLMMPEMGGYEFMRLYGKEADTPIMILTARVEENDRVLGLELGADDYMTKPFSMREMVARIHAILRRAKKSMPKSEVLRAADILLDQDGHQVSVGERPVDLTPSEFDLLAALMSAPGRVFTRYELLERLQDGVAFEGVERNIDVHIRNLRTKVEPDPRNPRYIETVYGVGYRFAVADTENG
jgi:two-component system, OmpR family, alkaline phosphatase synthesis response regulator PhoP